MNHAKSSVTRGTAPLSEMVVIVAAPDGLKSTLVMINEGQGRAEVHHYKFDGNPHPTEGGDARHLTFKRTGPRSAEITVIRSGQVTATRRMDVSSDGKTLSFNATGKSANGTPYTERRSCVREEVLTNGPLIAQRSLEREREVLELAATQHVHDDGVTEYPVSRRARANRQCRSPAHDSPHRSRHPERSRRRANPSPRRPLKRPPRRFDSEAPVTCQSFVR